MIAKIRAIYSNGVLTPLEPLDLEEGEEVTLDDEGFVELVENRKRRARSV